MGLEKIESRTYYQTRPNYITETQKIGDYYDRSPIPKNIKFIFDNKNGVPTSFAIFGSFAEDFVQTLRTGKNGDTRKDFIDANYFLSSDFLSGRAFPWYVAQYPILFDKIRCSTNNVNQFENDIKIYDVDIDGPSKPQVIEMNEALSANQFHQNIQTYEGEVVFGGRRAMIFKVAPETRLEVTLYVKAILNRL